jgi:hypothetical protein
MSSEIKHKAVEIVKENGGNAWGVDCCLQLSKELAVPMKDLTIIFSHASSVLSRIQHISTVEWRKTLPFNLIYHQRLQQQEKSATIQHTISNCTSAFLLV